MPGLHFSNALLCEDERVCVSADEERSASDIAHALHRLEEHVAKDGFIPNRLIGRAAKLVKVHHTLKYRFTDALRLRVVTVFLSAFQQKDRMQLTMRTKLLTLLCLVLKRSWGPLPLRLDWKLYWDEYMDVILRKDRHEVHTAEAVLQSYLNALCDFLLVARDFVDPCAPHAGLDSFQGEKNEWGSLVNYAMAKLTESRSPTMFEGVTLLFTLLPTHYAHYDALLPQWFALWTSLDNNEDWDYCWLTIVARARKHTRTFDWTPTLPFFLTCLRDLLNLPTGQEDMIASIQATAFPKGMPSFYRNTIQKSFAPDKDAVRKKIAKISKLLVFLLRREDAAALVKAESLQITLPSVVLDSLAKRDLFFAGFNLPPSTECLMRPSAAEIVLFLQSLRIYSHPSNSGTYVTSIVMLLSNLLTGICKIFGEHAAEQLIAQKQSSTQENAQETLFKTPSSLDKSLLFSLDHLMGVILTFCFEGLYSKSPAVCQRYMLLLLDLLTLKPLYAHAVLPFFLAALDPQASTQPHQSRSAIQALSRTLKTMLFPNPVLLEYLPEILKLSLEFVHPSDVAKTSFALDLFTNVFAWLPVSGNGMCKAISAERTASSSEKEGSGLAVREDMLRGSFPSYLQQFNVQTSGGSSASFSATQSAVHLESLLQYLQSEWVSLFLDKVFALIDAQEKPVEGSSPPTTMHIISRAMGFFFQAMDWAATGDAQSFHEEAREKILKYVTTSAPAHTAAVCAKMLECLLAADPSQLRTIISRMITEDLCKAEGNAEKIAFRVRVIGGCLRVATSEYIVPCFDLLRPLLHNMSLLCHEELSVREALAKLHKDLFKGCTASYPISYPVRCVNSTSLACPNIPTRDDVRWHSPSTQALVQSTTFLRETLTFLESNIRTALTTATQPTTVDETNTTIAAPLTLKRCEDMIASSLSVLCRVVRGVAEMIVEGEAVTATVHTTVTAQEGEEEDDSLQALRALPGTGRETLLARLSHNDSDRETVAFWRALRARLLSLLNEVDESLNHTQPAYRGLRDSVFLAKQWGQCLSLVLTRRVAFVKSCEQAHTMLRHYKRAYRSQFVKEIHKRLRAHAFFREELYDYSRSLSLIAQEEGTHDSTLTQLLSLSHWKFHDIPVNDLVNRAWNQRSLRARALARAALTHSVRLDDASDLTTIALRKLLALTRHEFDAIRPQARKAFEGIAAHLGFKIVSILRELLSFLYKPDATYVELASSLVLLKQSHAMRKIAADHQLKEMFLCSFVAVQRACAQIEEPDKREKAMLTLSDAFLKYTSMWQHTQRDLVFLQTQTIPQILELLGVQRDGENGISTENNEQSDGMDVAEANTQLPATTLTTAAAASVAPFVFTSNGLRLDVFLLYILLHSISSSSSLTTQGESVCSVTQRGLWAVALQQVTRAQAQPVQSLGVSMLCRLAEALLVSQQREGDIENHEDIQTLFNFYGTTSSSSSGLSIDAFLLGLAKSNPRSLNEDSQGGHKEGSQQWSHGVSSALNATNFLRIVKPRSFSSKRYETNLCSAFFRKDVAAMVYSLAACGLLVRGWTRESDRTTTTKRRQRNSDDELENKRMRANENDCVSQVKALLESVRELTVASESERRALNATRAELVAGLLRRLFELVTDAQRNGESERERELLACETAVLQFLTQMLEPLSMDFARDWQEGMAFAFETHYSSSTHSLSAELNLGPIASHFASAFASSLSSLCSDSTEKESDSENVSEDQDEGFTQHAKVMMLVNAIMHGDGSGKLFAQREKDLVFAERIARALKAPEVSLSLAYRALRVEMCSVLTSLLSYAPQSLNFERDITPKLIALLEQAQREDERVKEKESVSTSTTVVSADSADASSSTTVTAVATSVTTSLSPAQRRKKHAIELASLLIRQTTHYLPMSRAHTLFLSLLPLLGDGLAHSDPDVVKSAGDAIKSAVLLMLPLTACLKKEEKGFSAFGSVSPTSTFVTLVTKYNEQTGTSWKVREFVHKLATSFMLCNWFCLSNDERKLLKDLFALGVNDAHAAVQEAAKDGMVSYLCFKTGPELKTIADVYLRNSEALAAREKQKKKTAKGSIVSSAASKPDAQYWNVLQMISCVVQTSPYDLPAYLPALLVSFLRHAHYHDSSKQLLTKTMQVFQRTHQDRWEEFQKMFTPEQLQDLQGAGAAHYYA